MDMGTKTAMSDKVVAITANPICLEPLIEASRTGSLFSILLCIFSRTIIASSTTSPTAKTYARRVKTFIEKPNISSIINEEIKETGIATAGIKVAQNDLKNKNITAITKHIAIAKALKTSFMEASTNLDLS